MSGDLTLFFCQELGLVMVNIVGSGSFIILGFFLAPAASSSSSNFIRCSSDCWHIVKHFSYPLGSEKCIGSGISRGPLG